MASPQQQGPIVVYAATGFTGKLISRELDARGADFVIAGRSADKLAALSSQLDSRPETAAVGTDDPAGLKSLFEGAGAVIACAGPFSLHGHPVVKAAAEAGTHYLDTTGEQPFIHDVFEQYGPIAAGTGAGLVSGFGFDYVPGDMIAALTAEGLGELSEIDLAYAVRNFGPTRGTAHSALLMMGGGDIEWQDGEYRIAPRSTGRGEFDFPSPIGTKRVGRYPSGEQVTVPKHIDVSSVNCLMELEGLMGVNLGPFGAPLMTGMGYLFDTPLTKLLGKAIARLPEGPSDDARKAVRFTITCDVRTGATKRRRGVIRGKDIYGLTGVCLAEGALEMAAPGYECQVGALAPSQAFDPAAFLAKLADSGISYELIDLD